MIVALESLDGSDDPTSDELAAYAVELGEAAEKIATADPLPDRSGALRDLRAVRTPEGMDPLPDARLVTLAAATSLRAAASPGLSCTHARWSCGVPCRSLKPRPVCGARRASAWRGCSLVCAHASPRWRWAGPRTSRSRTR